MTVTAIVGGTVAYLATHYAIRRIERRQRATLDALERQALDATIIWAYNYGYGDRHARRHYQPAIAVTEFRHLFGDDRREVTG